MKKICTVITACIIAITITGCKSHQIVNLQDRTIPSLNDGSPPSLEVVQNAILAACGGKGWSAKVKGDNVIEANIMVRSHRASIEISFSRDNYSIIYKDSDNLGYKKSGKIHRNYNGWVTGLSMSIQRELSIRSQSI